MRWLVALVLPLAWPPAAALADCTTNAVETPCYVQEVVPLDLVAALVDVETALTAVAMLLVIGVAALVGLLMAAVLGMFK